MRPVFAPDSGEAAAFLRVSVGTLDKLGIRKSYVGRQVRYQRSDLKAYLDIMATRMRTPYPMRMSMNRHPR